MEDLSFETKLLVVTLVVSGLGIAITSIMGEPLRRLFKKKWQKKLENLFSRYVLGKFGDEEPGISYGNVRISSMGNLVADKYRDVLGHKVLLDRRIFFMAYATDYGHAILEILEEILEETGCKTAEELEMWLEGKGL